MTKPILTDFVNRVKDNPVLGRRPKTEKEWHLFLRELFSPEVRTFTPNWGAGFSSDPSGDLNYMIVFGFAIVWPSSDLNGTSDTTAMSYTGIPTAARPAHNVRVSMTAIDNGNSIMASVLIDVAGGATFSTFDSAGTNVDVNGAGWTATGTKGIGGNTMFYPISG